MASLPYTSSPESRSAVARANIAKRYRPNDPSTEALAREAHVQRLADHARAVVAQAPPLRPEQVDRIVAILRRAEGRLAKAGETA